MIRQHSIEANPSSDHQSSANTNQQDTRTIVDCEGRTVTITSAGYTQFCAISNTGNFLADLGEHALASIVALGRPERVSVVIPSYRSNHRLCATLLSLLGQRRISATEILVFINEPPDASPADRAANDATESWIRALIAGEPGAPDSFAARDAEVRQALQRVQDDVRLQCVRHVITGGMPAVYQTILSSFISRVRAYADAVGGTRAQKLSLLDDLLARTFLLICDDDIVLLDDDGLSSAYYHAVIHDSVVLGRLCLRKPVRADAVQQCVHDLMDCFLEIKYDIGVNALGPRGIVLRHALEAGAVTLDDPFGDQLYFARIAATHDRYAVAGRTFIEQAEYPSNGRMWRDLVDYLRAEADEGAAARAVNIFSNLVQLARSKNHSGRYSLIDIEELLHAIQRRHVGGINCVTERLRARAHAESVTRAADDDDDHVERRARSNHAAWNDNNINAAWGRWSEQLSTLLEQANQAFVRAAGPEPGHTVLDLASGPGDPALELAAAVAPSGSVIGTDIAQGMLRLARERAADIGARNVHFCLADAHDLPFDDDSFDIVTCRFGIMYFADPVKALEQVARVLRPRGRVVLMSWGSADQPYFRDTHGIIERHLATPRDPDGPNTFAYATPGSLSEVLRRAGFVELVEQQPSIELVWPGSAADMWRFFQEMTASLAERARQLSDSWPHIGAQVIAALERHRHGEHLRMPGEVNLAVARKPIQG